DNGDIIWDMEYDGNGNGKSDWMEVAEIGKELGFEWGGDWEGFKDYPHFQLRPEDIK
ncbi:M15 family metallopeptidase, partial [Escherichia coli]|nr:M15 family metallopeptidase [Escherichia coli]